MPNLAAYNSGGLVPNALQFGTIVMDVNNTVNPGSLIWCDNYGLCNQYFIITDSYTNGKTSQPSARAMWFPTTGLTDSALILSINKLAASKSSGPFTGLTGAITWAISEGYFIINQEYPSIVTSGCVANLDASLPASYPLVLNNWYDLSGNGNTGTLSGATYSSSSYGNLLFVSSSSNYISFTSTSNIPSGNSNYTISTWFNPSSLGTKGLVGWGNYGTTNQVNSFRLSATGLVNSWQGNDLSVTTSLSTSTWYNAVANFNGTTREIWVNGVSAGSDTPTSHNVTTTSNLTIGVTNNTEYFDGSIGEVQIFNRALTSTEIVQNYNALLPRYNNTYTDPCITPVYCTPTPTPTLSIYTFCLGYSATNCEIACSASCTTYYSYCPTLTTSCSLYTDTSGSTAPDGYYSDGVDCYHLVTPPVTPTPTSTPTSTLNLTPTPTPTHTPTPPPCSATFIMTNCADCTDFNTLVANHLDPAYNLIMNTVVGSFPSYPTDPGHSYISGTLSQTAFDLPNLPGIFDISFGDVTEDCFGDQYVTITDSNGDTQTSLIPASGTITFSNVYIDCITTILIEAGICTTPTPTPTITQTQTPTGTPISVTPTHTPTPSTTPAGIQATIAFSFFDDGSGLVSASMEVTNGVTLDSLSWGGTGIGYSSLGCSGTENTQSFSDVLGIGNTQKTTEVWGSISAILSAQNQTNSFTVNGNIIDTVSEIITVGGHNYVINGVTNCFSPLT